MHAAAALLSNDARSIRRDPLLIYLSLVPWLMVLLARTAVPGLTAWLRENYGFDLVPDYPLLVSFFFIMEIPMIIGVVMGLLLLDERDDGTLIALQVTPVSMAGYALYRMALTVGMSAVHILVCTPLTGMMPLSMMPLLIPIALLASLFAPLLTLAMAVFAGNKLEGLALMKGFGVFLVVPVAAYFIGSGWQALAGLMPSYWWAKAYWTMGRGAGMWVYLALGTVYHVLMIIWLLRRFERRLLR
jgi:fluoroquinolone transport system permease protein